MGSNGLNVLVPIFLQVPIPTKVSGQTEALRQDELRSDIFQIMMDEPGTVDITVPVYHCRENRANYPGLIVKVSHKTAGSQDRVEEFSFIEYMNGKVGRRVDVQLMHRFILNLLDAFSQMR